MKNMHIATEVDLCLMFIAAPWTKWRPTYTISHWRSRSTWRV